MDLVSHYIQFPEVGCDIRWRELHITLSDVEEPHRRQVFTLPSYAEGLSVRLPRGIIFDWFMIDVDSHGKAFSCPSKKEQAGEEHLPKVEQASQYGFICSVVIFNGDDEPVVLQTPNYSCAKESFPGMLAKVQSDYFRDIQTEINRRYNLPEAMETAWGKVDPK